LQEVTEKQMARRFHKSRRSEHSALGTPQNPEAEKNAISNDDYQRLRSKQEKDRRDRERAQEIERDRAEADKIIIQTLQDLARERGLKIPCDIAAVIPAPDPVPVPFAAPAPEPEPDTEPESEDSAPAGIGFVAPRKKSASRRRRPVPPAANLPEGDRHARKCAICRHADRDLIEQDFLHWHSAVTIACDYDLHDTRVVYRHAHATGIYSRRMKNIRMAAAHLVEQAECVTPSGGHVLSAIRAVTRIDDDGHWVEPPIEVVVSSGSHRSALDAKPAKAVVLDAPRLAAPAHDLAPENDADEIPVESQLIISNRSVRRLETSVTPSKQTTA
jgi:hypothetical protein